MTTNRIFSLFSGLLVYLDYIELLNTLQYVSELEGGTVNSTHSDSKLQLHDLVIIIHNAGVFR